MRYLTGLIILLLLLVGPAFAATYYVDKDHGSASDSNPGTESLPWLTIAYAVGYVVQDDIIYVKASTYNEGISLTSTNGIHIEAIGDVYLLEDVYISSDNNTVRGFDISDATEDAGVFTTGDGNLVDQNTIHDMGQDGIWFNGSNNTFTNNYIYDILDSSIGGDPHVDCFQTWGGYGVDTTNVLFEGNICKHTRDSGSNQILMLERQNVEEVRDITFKNNIFIMYDAAYTPMKFNRKTGQDVISGMTVINNTFAHPDNIGQAGIVMNNITNGVIKNNIFYNSGDSSNGYVSITGGGSVVVDYNLVYTTGDAPQGGPNTNDVWMEDPDFVNLGTLDFHLLEGSPAIDVGVTLGEVLFDLDGNDRPQGSAYDMGAYEFVIGGTGTSCSLGSGASTLIFETGSGTLTIP